MLAALKLGTLSALKLAVLTALTLGNRSALKRVALSAMELEGLAALTLVDLLTVLLWLGAVEWRRLETAGGWAVVGRRPKAANSPSALGGRCTVLPGCADVTPRPRTGSGSRGVVGRTTAAV